MNKSDELFSAFSMLSKKDREAFLLKIKSVEEERQAEKKEPSILTPEKVQNTVLRMIFSALIVNLAMLFDMAKDQTALNDLNVQIVGKFFRRQPILFWERIHIKIKRS